MWMGDYTPLFALVWSHAWHLGISHLFEEEWESYRNLPCQAGITLSQHRDHLVWNGHIVNGRICAKEVYTLISSFITPLPYVDWTEHMWCWQVPLKIKMLCLVNHPQLHFKLGYADQIRIYRSWKMHSLQIEWGRLLPHFCEMSFFRCCLGGGFQSLGSKYRLQLFSITDSHIMGPTCETLYGCPILYISGDLES